MKRLLILALLATPAFAVDTAPPTPPAPPAAKVEPYELKNRSTFTVERETRAPFWPIGWEKPKNADAAQPRVTPTGVVVAVQKFEIQPQHFNVTSVLIGRPSLATINGRSFAEGELLPVIAGKDRLRVVVKAIRDGGVWLEHDAHQIYVPLRRKEIEARPVDPQPASSDFSIKIGAQP